MKINPKLRTRVIILFIFIYSLTVIIFDVFIYRKMNAENRILSTLSLDKKLSEINPKNEHDRQILSNISSEYLQAVANLQSQRVKTAVYSSMILFFISLFSLLIFLLLIIKMTKPLDELKDATGKIAEGDFDINLSEEGYPEIAGLKKSFNMMTKNLVTLQKRLLEEEKNKIWKDFSKILAHEIKNPLTPIKLSLERLETYFYDDFDKFKEIFPDSLSIVYQEVEHLNILSKSFSEFSKSYQPVFEDIKLYDFIKNIISPYLSTYKIRLLCDSEDILISFDKKHLYQILTNLLQNAMEFSDGKEIIIKAKIDTNLVKISVADFGKGIKPQDMDKIFQPYFSKKKKGLGLGLAIVKKLVQINRANIKVYKNSPTGAVFEITKEVQNEYTDNR